MIAAFFAIFALDADFLTTGFVAATFLTLALVAVAGDFFATGFFTALTFGAARFVALTTFFPFGDDVAATFFIFGIAFFLVVVFLFITAILTSL